MKDKGAYGRHGFTHAFGYASGVIAIHKTREPPGGAAFPLVGGTREMFRYCFTVRGSVSLKLSMDSAGRTISFSPV